MGAADDALRILTRELGDPTLRIARPFDTFEEAIVRHALDRISTAEAERKAAVAEMEKANERASEIPGLRMRLSEIQATLEDIELQYWLNDIARLTAVEDAKKAKTERDEALAKLKKAPLAVDLHLPWSVDADAAILSKGEAHVVITANDGGIACLVVFDPGDPKDEGRARAEAAAICAVMDERLEGA